MEKIGQLIITGISGKELNEDERKFIQDNNIGGVILFTENYENPAQLAELVNSIQSLRDEYPLFICVDHEGGRVQRFKTHFTKFPAMLKLASLESAKIVFDVATVMAEELSACGINVNMSPVCDILNNEKNKVIGDRAFGKNKEDVSKYVSSIIRGLQTNNVMACAKHFPGHGCTTKDSHYDLPIVKKSLEEIREEEFFPFIKAAKARVEFVMMAHIIVEGIDPDLPCTLSKEAYKILREELKYKKLIITDDMEMKAITDRFSTEQAAVKAIMAGADIVEYRSMEEAKKALQGLKNAVKNNELSKSVINDRFTRIMESKKEQLSEYKPLYVPGVSKVIGRESSKALGADLLKRTEENPPL